MQLPQDIIIWLSQEPRLWIILTYLVLVNILAFLTMWWDKRKAKKEEWRVSEATLLIMSFIGGAIGILIGMFRFRHKTRKRAFQIIAVLGLIASLIIYWFEFRAIVWFLFYI
ncbi:MAG: DUF1294 domain-containing protein [Candidatus Sifarchaeia archaeon]